MRSTAFLAGILAFATVTATEAQMQDCTQPPVKDRADFALPCFKHPAAIDAELKVFFASNPQP